MLPAGFKARMSPVDAREALYRKLARSTKTGMAPADTMIWVRSHIRRLDDKNLSREEEKKRPWGEFLSSTDRELGGHGSNQLEDGNIFTLRQFPMYPGEYVPAGHNSLASLRDNLTQDMLAQNMKNAWMSITGGEFFRNSAAYYRRSDGLDEKRLQDIVGALFPTLDQHDTRALIRKTLETLATESNTSIANLNKLVTAESLGLDNSPEHYTNFLEWMSRLMDTVGFKTEHALYNFCAKKFDSYDARVMYENKIMMGESYLQAAKVDGYTHYYTIMKDYIHKISAKDTKAQTGVRIDPPEVDLRSGTAIGWGWYNERTVVALVRENKDSTGQIFLQGEPLGDYLGDKAWWMEMFLQPFDEAGLNFKDFDVYLTAELIHPHGDKQRLCKASRLAISMALTKMMPITRIHLKKSGNLSFSRRKSWGDKPGKRGKNHNRFFKKR